MELKGKLSDLKTQGTVSNFVLRGADGSETLVQTSNPMPPGLKNGDSIVVHGYNPPDPPFLADSVKLIEGKKTPWLLIGAVVAVLLVIVGLAIHFFNRPPAPAAGSTWTIHATDSGAAAANVSIQLLDANKQPLKSAPTDANGDAAFVDLAPGTYYASGPGVPAPVSVSFSQPGSQQTSQVGVQSPFTWTVNTVQCSRPDANNQLQLESPAKEIVKIGVTDGTGKFVFTNLSKGTYTVFGPNNLSGAATLNGTTVPAPVTLTIPQPPNGCIIFLNPGLVYRPHSLIYATPPPGVRARTP
jgi:hypothetical protein